MSCAERRVDGSNELKVRSSEGDVVSLAPSLVHMSSFLKAMSLVSEDCDEDVPTLMIETAVLKQVLEYCSGTQHHDSEFLRDLPEDTFCKLYLAAHLLDTEPLLHILSKKIVPEDWLRVHHYKCFAVQHVKLQASAGQEAVRVILQYGSRLLQVKSTQIVHLRSQASISSPLAAFRGVAFTVRLPQNTGVVPFSLGLTSKADCPFDFAVRVRKASFVSDPTLCFDIYESGELCAVMGDAKNGDRIHISINDGDHVEYRLNDKLCHVSNAKTSQDPLHVELCTHPFKLRETAQWSSLLCDLQWTCAKSEFELLKQEMCRGIATRELGSAAGQMRKRRKLNPTLSG